MAESEVSDYPLVSSFVCVFAEICGDYEQLLLASVLLTFACVPRLLTVKTFVRWIPPQFQGVGPSRRLALSTDALFQELFRNITGQQTPNWLGAEEFNVLD